MQNFLITVINCIVKFDYFNYYDQIIKKQFLFNLKVVGLINRVIQNLSKYFIENSSEFSIT